MGEKCLKLLKSWLERQESAADQQHWTNLQHWAASHVSLFQLRRGVGSLSSSENTELVSIASLRATGQGCAIYRGVLVFNGEREEMGCTPTKSTGIYTHDKVCRDLDTCSTFVPSMKSSESTPEGPRLCAETRSSKETFLSSECAANLSPVLT